MRLELSEMKPRTRWSSFCISASFSCTRFTAFWASSAGNISASEVTVPAPFFADSSIFASVFFFFGCVCVCVCVCVCERELKLDVAQNNVTVKVGLIAQDSGAVSELHI